MSDVVIVSAVRTAVGTPVGALAPLGAGGLGDAAVRAAISRAGLAAEMVDAVLFADEIGAPNTAATPGGGLRSLMRAADRLASGDVEVVVAAARGAGPTDGDDDRTDALAAVEAIARRCDLTRVELESFALTSRLRVAAAARAGRFVDEIVPVGSGAISVDHDETIRQPTDPRVLPDPRPAAPGAAKTSIEALAPTALGGAALVLTRADIARRRGLPILARLVATAEAEASTIPEAAIAGAARAAARSLRWDLDGIDLVEIDEISAAHALTAWRDLGIELARINVLGGALGLGGPSGASDLRMVVTLLHELRRRDLRTGLASGDDGGVGRAVCVERI